ncbi:DUF2852 domain-containing protein [Camelimonas sp. ID_303_24]
MSHTASTSTTSPQWDGARAGGKCGRPPRRALEIVGIVFAFIWFWPLAVAYIAWKLMGYPVPNEFRAFMERNFTRLGDFPFGGGRSADARPANGPTGNSHFDDYRRAEIERLEAERRRLDDEVREFGAFVEELKRAKDREEFDAYMRKRRSVSPTTEV